MKDDTKRVRVPSVAFDDISTYLREWYPVPVLSVALAFMLWVRLQAYGNFVHDGEVFFDGNDPYYHYRQISYTVQHWPFTMPFDPWTRFPYGVSVGHFGTLYDQIIATAALLVGLGSPTARTVAEVTLVAPAVFGALVAIPVYFIGKRLSGRLGGVFAVVLLALLPGTFLRRSVVGFADHHVAEVLFQSLAIVGTMVALAVAEREKPVYEQLVDRDWRGLREPVTWSVVAGVLISLYIWVWPPGVVLIGILGVFYVVVLSANYVRGRTPEYLAFVAVISLSVVAVLTLVKLDSVGFSAPRISLLQPLLALSVAAGAAFMAWLAREWDRRDISELLYPAVIATLIVAGFAFIAVALPDLFGTIQNNALRAFGFGQSDTTLTIQEAKAVPFDSLGDFMYREYGFTYLTALVGLLWLGGRMVYSGSHRAEYVLVVVWAVFITLMSLTQIRFHYYLAVVVAVLTAWLLVRVVAVLDLPTRAEGLSEVKGYQILSVAAILLLVLVPLVTPLGATTAVEAGQRIGPGSVVTWDEELDWMAENTPAPGTYGGATDEMAYYGTYEATNDFAYPEGAYGVISWWDYGHWITVKGERIPTANPFQQGARPASAFLQAQSEERATLILEALPSLQGRQRDIDGMSNDELRGVIANQSRQEAGEDTRYVMIDDQMAAGKFAAIATWTGPGYRSYLSRQEFTVDGQKERIVGLNERYRNTMLARLYFEDARNLSHYRLVHETEARSSFVSIARRTQSGVQATNFINRRLSGQVFRIVQQRPDLYFYDVRQASRVKTFERVEGATLTGSVEEPDTTVTAFVRLRTNTGRNFTYVKTVQVDSDGEFSVTVPYPTEETVGPAEGGTDSGVVARGNYTVFSGDARRPNMTGHVDVPEPAVLTGETITVEMTEFEGQQINRTGNVSVGNETAGNESTGNESAGDTSPGNESPDNQSAVSPTPAQPGGTSALAEPIAPNRDVVVPAPTDRTVALTAAPARS